MHAFAIVLVPADEPDIPGYVEKVLAPYNEQGPEAEAQPCDANGDPIDYDPNRFWWDWWRIGGRWDGLVRRLDGLAEELHYTAAVESLERNVVPVSELGECRPFTLVTPEGIVSHREMWVPDPGKEFFPWKIAKNPDHDRVVGERCIAHRDHLAVGVDYHS